MKNINMPTAEQAIAGRNQAIQISGTHFVSGHSFNQNIPDIMEKAVFGLGCFWGAERLFWLIEGVYATAVGYSAGFTVNPNYQEVCTGMTGHNEVVLVIFDPAIVSYEALLAAFWEAHDPTQGMRQGNDIGTQYRSGIYTFSNRQMSQAETSRELFQQLLTEQGMGLITTEIMPVSAFYFAEEYHQQYLAKNPNGYCGLRGTGLRLNQ
ncbi:MAG: peptide-methionine (S)-S-oxide reductase MsrA [Gammaproteobacteria bacterium]|nr:peptide-methionine (S)-S-oxide reductase MsrA [Gammaproteobacteria bacterium]MDH5734983.1 peptide-methionine (S)-S-oxide reductase MsrA [Gammaproteobacteria bacterium]